MWTVPIESEEGERDERPHEREEPKAGDAGRARTRPGDPGTQAPLAPLHGGPDDGRWLCRWALGPLRRLRARRSRWTAAANEPPAIHRGDTQSLARPGARHGPAGRERAGATADAGLADFPLPFERRSFPLRL